MSAKKINLLILISSIIYTSNIFPSEYKSKDRSLRIGIYSGRGVGFIPGREKEYATMLVSIIEAMIPESRTGLISSGDIFSGVLKRTDVIIFPGGSGRGQSKSLGNTGRSLVRKFVKRGGGFIGLCAGAYIGQSYDFRSSSYGLKLANATLFKRGRNWNRGGGIIKISLTDSGKRHFPELKGYKYIYMHFNNGPLLIHGNIPGMPDYDELMKIESDIYHDRPSGRGESKGKTFLLKTMFGKGVVILVSGHPEATPGSRWLLARMVHVAGKKGIIRYPDRFVKPGKYPGEIMFDRDWKKMEKYYLNILAGRTGLDVQSRIESMEKLKVMASRNLTGLFNRLLTDREAGLRRAAAEAVVFYDFFPVKPNIKNILRNEKDRETRAFIQRSIKHLEAN